MKNIILNLLVISSVMTSGCAAVSDILSQDSEGYNFRKTRWGYTRDQVALNEQGNTIAFRTENELVYKTNFTSVPCYVIYTFRDNKLRAAGYLPIKPVKSAKSIITSLDKDLGEPTMKGSFMGENHKFWRNKDTIVYLDYSILPVSYTRPEYETREGLLRYLPNKPPSSETPTGMIYRWDSALVYVDKQFYTNLHEVDLPMSELSFYEKRLFGVLKRPSRVLGY